MKYWFLVLLTVFCSIPVFSQNSYRERYMDAAGSSAILFSGKAAPHYPYRYMNSHYAYGDVYQPGTLCYDGICYDGVLMNLDVCAGCLCVRENPVSMPVALDDEKISDFSYGGHRFRNMGDDGYVEILGESSGMLLIKKMRKIPMEDLDNVNVVRYFQDRVTFWLIKSGGKSRISSENTFHKLFPEKKRELKILWKSFDNSQRENAVYSYAELFKVISEE